MAIPPSLWPQNTPQLSPLDYMIYRSRGVYGQKVHNIDEMRKCVIEEWKHLECVINSGVDDSARVWLRMANISSKCANVTVSFRCVTFKSFTSSNMIHMVRFLADLTNGRAYVTVLRLSVVVCLSVQNVRGSFNKFQDYFFSKDSDCQQENVFITFQYNTSPQVDTAFPAFHESLWNLWQRNLYQRCWRSSERMLLNVLIVIKFKSLHRFFQWSKIDSDHLALRLDCYKDVTATPNQF